MKKVLIWIGCLLPAAILFTTIERNGYMLNPLLKTLIAVFSSIVAIKICKTLKSPKKIDHEKNTKEIDINTPSKDECPSCFHKISKDDKECSYCGYILKK